jgi:transposase
MRVSILVEEQITPLPKKDTQIGIDLGLKTLMATSDGQTFENPKYAARDAKKLTRAQRRLAHKQQGSREPREATTPCGQDPCANRRQKKTLPAPAFDQTDP